MSARDYEQWREAHTWDPSRDSGLVLQTDLAPASWIEPLLPDLESAHLSMLPGGFEACARIFFPYVEEDMAGRRERVAESLAEPMPGIGRDDQAAHCGFVPPGQFRVLLPILARHTSSAVSWFLLWDGFWWPDDRAWCACADTDWGDYSYIAGSAACITEILRACDPA
jgi:hypothetical protein